MGPPPDAEHMIGLLENPNFVSTMNEALQNPQIVDHMIQSNPLLRHMGPQIRQAMQDPEFRRMMTDPAVMRQMAQATNAEDANPFSRLGRGGAFPAPGITDTTPAQEGERTNATANSQNPWAVLAQMGVTGPNAAGGGAAGAAHPFAGLLQGLLNPGTAGTPGAGQGQDTAAAGTQPGANDSTTSQPPANIFANLAQNPIFQNPALMQQVLGAMGGGEAGSPGAPAQPGGFNPFAMFGEGPSQPENPNDTRPPEERYEQQLRQLNDMGFYEFDRNVEALRRTGGSVQGAVEYLLTH